MTDSAVMEVNNGARGDKQGKSIDYLDFVCFRVHHVLSRLFWLESIFSKKINLYFLVLNVVCF